MLKLLYVNGTHEGGSLASTRELLRSLAPEKVESHLVSARPERALPSYLTRRATNLAVKLGGPEPSNVLERLNRLPGRTSVDLNHSESSSTAVENATRAKLAIWNPDVVVASSVSRVAWRRIRKDCADQGVPCVLYLREESLLPHLALTTPPEAVFANSRGIVETCKRLGWAATLVPSAVDLARSSTNSTRTTALLINPTRPYGLELAADLARACPDIRFVFQESTRLSEQERRELEATTISLSNVEHRSFVSKPALVYRDARVLLAPYSTVLESNRPRSVLEAQRNGIPILGAERSGLRDAAGDGGLLLSPDSLLADWCDALNRFFEETGYYAHMSSLARIHSMRPEVETNAIAKRFVDALTTLV